MQEEWVLEEFAVNASAVDRVKGFARTDAFFVDRAGDQFLARARRAAEHHRSVRARHAADHLAQPAGCRARPDDQRFERRIMIVPQCHFTLHRTARSVPPSMDSAIDETGKQKLIACSLSLSK